MENKNIITFCSCKPSQKNNTEAHENLLVLMKKAQRYWMNLKIQYQKIDRHSDNYRVYIYSETWMWQDKKNWQSKNVLPLYTVLLSYSKVKASQILHGGTTPVAPSKNWIKAIYSSDQKNTSCLSYLLGSRKITRKIMLT